MIELTALNGSIFESEPGDDDVDINAKTVRSPSLAIIRAISTTSNGIEVLADNIVLDGGDRVFLNPQNPPGTPDPIVTFGPNPSGLAILGGQTVGGADIHLYKQAITVLDPYNAIQLFILSDPSFQEAGELILSYEGME